MLKLRKLRIEKFRNVKPGTVLEFSDGFNVLLGQNGTGKTTLLELISRVVRSDFSDLAREEFAIAYQLEMLGEGVLAVSIENREKSQHGAVGVTDPSLLNMPDIFRPKAELTAYLKASQHPHVIRYDAETGLHVGDQAPTGPTGIPSCLAPGFLIFYLAQERSLANVFVKSVLTAGRAKRFDESLRLFEQITDAKKGPGEFLQLGRGIYTPNMFAPALVPDALMRRIVAMYEPRKADYLIPHTEVEFLGHVESIMGFVSAEIRIELAEQSTSDRSYEHARFGGLVFRFWWKGGEFVTHDRLSYGQKRLLTFFYYLASNPDIVIADELVNGLHHQWITACIDAIGDRQAFLTSQNPLLLDYLPFTSAEQVQKSFILCKSEQEPGSRPRWTWANMTDEAAAAFFSAYEVGIEHVSEILQSQGLF